MMREWLLFDRSILSFTYSRSVTMRRLASVLLLTPLLLLTSASLIQPALAGGYYDHDGYYGGHHHHHGYHHSDCCYERVVKYRRVYRDEYHPHHHAHYGPYDGYRSGYYEAPRYYSDFPHGYYAGSCRRRVLVNDYHGDLRDGWVSGC